MQSQEHGRLVPIPAWLQTTAVLKDELPTKSSALQEETAKQCLPRLLDAETGVDVLPPLARSRHLLYLHNALVKGLASGYVALDASRPWHFYWCLFGLSVLGQDVTRYRESLVETLRPMQNTTGGIAGGQAQYSHLATTYASILSIVIVGGQGAFDLVDRRAMWHWLGRLKLPTGNFEVCKGGEQDVRGAYCALVVLSLFNLPLELPPSSPARSAGLQTFLAGLPEWISRCQTFEGGITNVPGSEAHGAYTFCAIACLCIIGKPHEILPRYLNLPALIRWLSARQHAPEGGLAGRTNKVVDGCYSHWLGGCWSLLEAAVYGNSRSKGSEAPSLWNREALIRYILCCCQADSGGLRDKPSMRQDPYHSCYNLAGLSSAQNRYYYEDTPESQPLAPLTSAFQWRASAASPFETQIFDESDRVSFMHPVYVVPWGAAERVRAYFEQKPGF